MSSINSYHCQRSVIRAMVVCAIASVLSACKPDGFINQVKYKGEKYVNTCETLKTEVDKLIASNSNPQKLDVSEYDNSDFAYYYMEPGQFDLKNDTLFFRLSRDLKYPSLLDKGVAVHVNATYAAASNIQDLEKAPEGDLGTLVVDRAYYAANFKPFFLYKFPLNGQDIAGKQVSLTFQVVKYDKKGNIKKYFCETEATPIGTATPACCTAQPWEAATLQSVVENPAINIETEEFKYGSFTGFIDVLFNEGSYKLSDDSAFSTMAIQTYVNKYKGVDYKIDGLGLTGYASPGGRQKLNQKLSLQRAQSLKEGLEVLNGDLEGIEISATGAGEDWDRVKQLTTVSLELTDEQKAEALAIIDDETLSVDQKEAKLRKLKFWETLVDDVLIKARHTYAVMDFAYEGELPSLKKFSKELPVASTELEQIATDVIEAKAYTEGQENEESLETLQKVLTEKANPNLYAMRATYWLANEDYERAITDLEQAGRFRGENSSNYSLAVKGYKVMFADAYDFDTKKNLFKEFSKEITQDPTNLPLFFNRAILMDKIGYLSGALTEYDNLLQGRELTAANYNNRGVARLKASMISAAEADFLAAAELDNNMAHAYYNLAVIYAYRGFTQKTMENLDKAVELEPKLKAQIFDNPAFSVMSEDSRFDRYR
ncbi:TPR end-of-group domain-containing protein [Pontibacter sp. G13]|uniref:TPR end-of-group domain-containing protein n=1 Tax=Pontibacter sp. G13 TaxID=3074898 RepID=UPI00288B4837|nr:hypothetical protein [Pontibacter sp. G13]WNJ16903.1 hypothetical protein RJD25_18725 [Pontibacter sp. G13]